MATPEKLPRPFFWRRMQSLMGLWLVIFLIEHLLTNSQAALLVGDDGNGFVRAVNFIHNLPYLPAIELGLLALPILIHAIWGIQYLMTSKANSMSNTGKDPYLPQYPRNHAYTWQRITSWMLLLGITLHVAQMRFINYPTTAQKGTEHYYMIRVTPDSGIYTLADRLGTQIYSKKQIQEQREELLNPNVKAAVSTDTMSHLISSLKGIFEKPAVNELSQDEISKRIDAQHRSQEREWLSALEAWPLENDQAVAVSGNFGTATLLAVRETFKSPIMIVLYTLFVMAAVFHGFNGLWTFCITWGMTLTVRSQAIMRAFTTGLMLLIGFLGMAAIWGTYWINLKS
ncbi:MAG: succinate dehydrogenase [Chlamydiales bacterium]|nr:succinate dehydrogenase [Chlamydiia bacterium]MCP5507486.1 succinate dehydrogenase [Chlamydiales bacterium]